MDYTQLYDAIAAAEIITIFRHQRPDCDALGSQFGLKKWIRDNFPEKKVYALGFEQATQGKFPAPDWTEDREVRDSLAIVLDTANLERADDQRLQTASYMIRIDHHPKTQDFGDLLLINDKAAATCEILANFFASTNSIVSSETAEYLYMGLLTDTLCFKTSNTTADTLKAAAYLAGFSIDIPVINRLLFDHPYSWFSFDGCLYQLVDVRGGKMACAIVTDDILKKYHLSGGEARNHVDLFSDVIEFEIWAMFTERIENGVSYYDGSVRSKKIVINDIVQSYGGGGHKNAAGVKDLSEAQMHELIDRLFARIPSE